jgi:Gpi18-like mannosyltransferase
VSPPPVEAAALEQVLPGEVLPGPRFELVEELRRPRGRLLSAELRRDLVAVVGPFVGSRLLIFGVGALTMLLLGVSAAEWAFDPYDISTSFGRVGNLLAASAVRWDSIYYLQIAQHGYQHMQDVAFFPLYPLLIRLVAVFTGSFVIAGVLISATALLATLVIVRRLTVLELGEQTADLTVRLLAFGPMAIFLSAIYTESLFLALSSGAFYAGRRGRWATAGVLGGLAATSRSGGILLLAPLLILFLWGPRTDAPPRVTTSRWKPRYRVTPAAAWLLLIPLGAGSLNFYFSARGFGSAAPLHAQELFHRHSLVFPLVGLWQSVVAEWHQLGLILTATPLTNDPSQTLFQFSVLLVTIAALVGIFRRLPLAYGVYTVLGSVVVSLSVPAAGDPLSGFARYASLRFPLFMFAALWAIEHKRSRTVQVCFVLGLILATVQFANWQVVGTPTL